MGELEARIIDLLKTGVQSSDEIIRRLSPTYSEDEIMRALAALRAGGRLKANSTVPTSVSFAEFLFSPEYSLWFVLSCMLFILALLSVFLSQFLAPVEPLRWVVGLGFAFFVPGYAMLQLLFPGESQLDGFERPILSILFSFVILVFAGLVLNFLPVGITAYSSLVLGSALTVIFGVGAEIRKFRLAQSLQLESPRAS